MRRREGFGLEVEAEEGTLQSPASLAETGQWEVGWWGRSVLPALEGTWEPGAYSPKRNLGRKTCSQGWA